MHIKQGLITAAAVLALTGAGSAADLVITGEDGTVYDGGTYGTCSVKSSRNITIRNCSFSSAAGQVVDITQSSSGIVLENCDINGQEETCQAVNIYTCTDVTVRNCHVYNAADDGIVVSKCSGVVITGNEIHNLIGKGTDTAHGTIPGPCYNGHSDGIEMNETTDLEISGNLIYDIDLTSAIMLRGWSAGGTDIRVFNNICYATNVGFVVYLDHLRGAKVYNNSVYGGSYGGIAVGGDNQGLVMKNNMTSAINFSHMNETYDPAVNDYSHNLVGAIGGSQGYTLLTGDVFAPNPLITDIGLVRKEVRDTLDPVGMTPLAASPAIGKGITGPDVPETDYFGDPRVGAPDMGAVEYQGTADVRDGIKHIRSTAGARKTVYAVDGSLLYHGTRMPELGRGVYLVRQGAGNLKKMNIQ